MNEDRFRRGFLLILLVAITAIFTAMIRDFLLTILLAAIFSGLVHPLYLRFVRILRGHRSLASVLTLLLLILVVLLPLLMVLGIVAAEAFRVSEEVGPWINARINEPDLLMLRLESIPGIDRLEPYRNQLLEKAGTLVGGIGRFLFTSISATTMGTVTFLFQFFIFIYAMYFFLIDGKKLLWKILYYLPLDEKDETRMVDKFVSVARATLKGTFLVGILQGTLAGAAMAIAGVEGALFWGTLMILLSVVPGLGTALVWLPAAVILLATGDVWQGVFLIVFCGLVVGSIDNLLRPRVVGRDTQMHELMIFLSTLGGLLLFGVVGVIVGPILAALFVTVWEMYGHAFRDVLARNR